MCSAAIKIPSSSSTISGAVGGSGSTAAAVAVGIQMAESTLSMSRSCDDSNDDEAESSLSVSHTIYGKNIYEENFAPEISSIKLKIYIFKPT